MEKRTLAALGLAAGGVAQVGYGAFMGGSGAFALVSFGEGAGLLLAALGVARAPRLPGTWVVAGLTLAAVCALPWFTAIPQDPVGATSNVLNNTGSVVAAGAVLAWTLAVVSPTLGANALRIGVAMQALGTVVRLPFQTAVTEWTLAFALAFAGFALAAWALPSPAEAAAQPASEVRRAARKAP